VEKIKRIYYRRCEVSAKLNLSYYTVLKRIKKAGLQEFKSFTEEQIDKLKG